MASSPRICPGCTKPIRQRDAWAARDTVRWHLSCAPQHGGARRGAGAKPLPAGQARTALAKARLTPAEKAALLTHCSRQDTTESELIRERLGDIIG
jgi:hypothetical protein